MEINENDIKRMMEEVRRDYYKQYNKKNKERLKEYQKRWRTKNQEKVKQYEQNYWRNKAIERLAQK